MSVPPQSGTDRLWLGLICLCVTVVASPAWAQQLGQASESSTISAGQVISLILFLALLLGAAWLTVRLRGEPLNLLMKASGKRLRVHETVRVAPQAHLCLVQLDTTEYLIALSGQSVQLLASQPAPDPAAGDGQ